MRQDLIVQDIEQTKEAIQQVKKTISNLRARRHALSSQPVVSNGQNLNASLKSFLPGNLMPRNVGHISNVAWQFAYTMDFNLSQTSDWPNLTSNTRQTRSFTVSQEAAFLLMGIVRHSNDYNDAGDLGPLTLEFRDRQSSRYFNDSPIPIQMIGQKGFPTYLPIPMLILPNAVFEATLATSLDDGVSQNTPGGSSGVHHLTMLGYRTRIEDAEKVLSSIFG